MTIHKNNQNSITILIRIFHNKQSKRISKKFSFREQYSCYKVDFKNAHKFQNKWNSIIQRNFNQKIR